MPSKSRKRSKKSTPARQHLVFVPLLVLTLVLWFVYRSLFVFPVWFDEIIGKAIFFGIPVWLYITVSQFKPIIDSFSPEKLQIGLLLGLAVGGTFGFVGSIMGIVMNGGIVQAAPLFISSRFWWEFFLALMTGFWESLFFFSWIMVVVLDRWKKWPLLSQLLLVVALFVLFHIPNSIIRFEGWVILAQIMLMTLFALGQALIFLRWRNMYALVITQAIWGMVLLVHVT